jgi:hypothetical protein
MVTAARSPVGPHPLAPIQETRGQEDLRKLIRKADVGILPDCVGLGPIRRGFGMEVELRISLPGWSKRRIPCARTRTPRAATSPFASCSPEPIGHPLPRRDDSSMSQAQTACLFRELQRHFSSRCHQTPIDRAWGIPLGICTTEVSLRTAAQFSERVQYGKAGFLAASSIPPTASEHKSNSKRTTSGAHGGSLLGRLMRTQAA